MSKVNANGRNEFRSFRWRFRWYGLSEMKQFLLVEYKIENEIFLNVRIIVRSMYENVNNRLLRLLLNIHNHSLAFWQNPRFLSSCSYECSYLRDIFRKIFFSSFLWILNMVLKLYYCIGNSILQFVLLFIYIIIIIIIIYSSHTTILL
jgi:hypothetical protein